MKGVYIFLADGFEDIEALATNDVFRRAGIQAKLVSITEDPFVQSSHGITVGIDMTLEELDTDHNGTNESDIMIFPGGMPGSKNLANCRDLIRLMKEHYAAGGSVAAICAAPGLVLSQLDNVKGVHFTCYDGFSDPLCAKGAEFTPAPAVTDHRIITGRGPGYAIEFGLEIIKKIAPEKVASVDGGLYLR